MKTNKKTLRVFVLLAVVGVLPLLSCRPPVTPESIEFTSLGKNAQGFEEFREEQTGIVFVKLPGGKFQMRSPASEAKPDGNEYPVHEVTLSPFLIAKYEVTQAQWKRVMGTSPSYFKGDELRRSRGTTARSSARTPGCRFRRRRSGNTPAGLGQRRPTTQVLARRTWRKSPGTTRTPEVRRILSARRSRTTSDSTICTATCGSGARMNTRRTPTARSAAAAASAPTPGSVIRRTAPGSLRTTASAAGVFAPSGRYPDRPYPSRPRTRSSLERVLLPS